MSVPPSERLLTHGEFTGLSAAVKRAGPAQWLRGRWPLSSVVSRCQRLVLGWRGAGRSSNDGGLRSVARSTTRSFYRLSIMASAGLILGGCGFPLLDQGTFQKAVYEASAPRIAPSLAQSPFGQEVTRAVMADPQLVASQARVRGSSAELDGTQAAAMPQLSVGIDVAAGLVGVTTGMRYLPVLQVSQLLFDGGRMRARVESARLGVAGRMIERDTLAAQVTLNAAEAWFELAHQRRLLGIAERNLQVHEIYIGQLEERLRAGAGVQGDVEIARGRLATAAARAATVQADLERAEANYARIFGQVPGRLGEAPLAPSLPSGTESELIANSPRLRGLDVAINVSQAGVEAAEASWWPTVTLGLRGQYDIETRRAGVETFGSPRYDVFTGGQQAATIAQAVARLEELRAERRQLEREIVRTLAVLRSDARAGQRRLQAARGAVRANEGSVDSARERFSVGRTSILQLLDAQRDLALAEELASTAERDLSLSGYAALALTGDITHAFGIPLPGLEQAVSGQAPPSEPPVQVANGRGVSR